MLYGSHNQEDFAHLWVAEDLTILTNWCRNNQLTVNINKTKVMLFGSRNMLNRGTRNDIFIGRTIELYEREGRLPAPSIISRHELPFFAVPPPVGRNNFNRGVSQ